MEQQLRALAFGSHEQRGTHNYKSGSGNSSVLFWPLEVHVYGACTDMRANIHTHKTIRFKSAFGPRSRGTPVVLELINQKQEDHEFKSKVVWALGSVVRLPQNQ